jgi:hypothetical protein
VAKRGYLSEDDLAEVIPCVLYELKAWLSIADYFCFSIMSSWLIVSNMPHNRSRWLLQARCPLACACNIFFCQVFSRRFNIMSAFLSTNRSLGRKKSILAKVCFDAKRG